MEVFRKAAEDKHLNLIKKKELVEEIIEKEKLQDKQFIDEVAKEYEKEDFGKNL